MDNQHLAQHLRDHARTLDVECGNLYRVRAYRRAAQTVLELDEPVTVLLERGGRRGLEELPGIGSHISLAIESLIHTGEMPPREKVSEPAAA
jgi:DNA polymerase/3'-5' exonuclease PolX